MAEGQRGPTAEQRRKLEAAQRENLGKRIRRRREQLELSLRDVVKLTGMSTTTWINAEQGTTSPLGITLAKFNRALRWPPGTSQAILAGKPATFSDLDETKSGDIDDFVIRWIQAHPGIDPLAREYMVAVIAKARGVHVPHTRSPGDMRLWASRARASAVEDA